jgi:hypothetical protein
MFRWLQAVPIESYSLEVRWDALGDLIRPSHRRRYEGAEDVALPLTEERYRVRGFDTSDAVENLFYTFVKRDGSWRIASDTDLDDLGITSARHMWDFGPLDIQREGRFLFVTHACRGQRPCSRVPEELPRLAQAGFDRVDRYWEDWDRRVIVKIPATEQQLVRMLQVTFDIENFVAFTYSTLDTAEGVEFTAPRIVFNEEALATRSAPSVVEVLAHELVHVGTRPAAGAFIPVFIEEGFAEHIAAEGRPGARGFLAESLRTGLVDARLPEDYEFLVGDAAEVLGQYRKGQSAVDYFGERWGMDTFRDFYRDLGGRRLEAGTARYHLTDALKEHTGLGFAGFQRAWASSIQE